MLLPDHADSGTSLLTIAFLFNSVVNRQKRSREEASKEAGRFATEAVRKIARLTREFKSVVVTAMLLWKLSGPQMKSKQSDFRPIKKPLT